MSGAGEPQAGDLVVAISSKEIGKILECPVCQEISLPPIVICEYGHIICSVCRPKLICCAVCRESYTKTRNFSLEAIFCGTTFACKYKVNGCPEIIIGDVYKAHLRNCQFRSISCGDCSLEIYPIENYISHIKNKHKAFGYDSEMEEYKFKNWTDDIHEDSVYGDEYAFFDGKYFLSSMQVKDQIVFQWISLIGNDEEAKKYRVKITTFKNGNNNVPQVDWTIPVVSIQNGEPDYSMCTAIPVNPTLTPFLEKNVEFEDGKIWEYVWQHKYTIYKL